MPGRGSTLNLNDVFSFFQDRKDKKEFDRAAPALQQWMSQGGEPPNLGTAWRNPHVQRAMGLGGNLQAQQADIGRTKAQTTETTSLLPGRKTAQDVANQTGQFNLSQEQGRRTAMDEASGSPFGFETMGAWGQVAKMLSEIASSQAGTKHLGAQTSALEQGTKQGGEEYARRNKERQLIESRGAQGQVPGVGALATWLNEGLPFEPGLTAGPQEDVAAAQQAQNKLRAEGNAIDREGQGINLLNVLGNLVTNPNLGGMLGSVTKGAFANQLSQRLSPDQQGFLKSMGGGESPTAAAGRALRVAGATAPGAVGQPQVQQGQPPQQPQQQQQGRQPLPIQPPPAMENRVRFPETRQNEIDKASKPQSMFGPRQQQTPQREADTRQGMAQKRVEELLSQIGVGSVNITPDEIQRYVDVIRAKGTPFEGNTATPADLNELMVLMQMLQGKR